MAQLNVLSIALLLFTVWGCRDKNSAIKNEPSPASSISVVSLESVAASVEMPEYYLITALSDTTKVEADQLMKVKLRWPMAMQSLDRNEFEAILADNFTFIDAGNLINRKDYIDHRTTPDEWKITHVKYSNVSLQLMGNNALLTYRNEVTNQNSKSGSVETERMSWADYFVKERGLWKILTTHVIDFKLDDDTPGTR